MLPRKSSKLTCQEGKDQFHLRHGNPETMINHIYPFSIHPSIHFFIFSLNQEFSKSWLSTYEVPSTGSQWWTKQKLSLLSRSIWWVKEDGQQRSNHEAEWEIVHKEKCRVLCGWRQDLVLSAGDVKEAALSRRGRRCLILQDTWEPWPMSFHLFAFWYPPVPHSLRGRHIPEGI